MTKDLKKLLINHMRGFKTMFIFAIKDVKSGFTSVFPRANEQLAQRDFSGAVNGAPNQLNMFPEDFELWKVAEFNVQSGEVKSDLKFITNAISVKETQKNE